MTTITYQSGGDTHLRPSQAFAANGTILTATADEYAINNPANGYSIHLIPDFGKFSDPEGSPSGTIQEVKVEDSHGHVYVDITDISGDYKLDDFLSNLQTYGTKAALDALVGYGPNLTGSVGPDQVETYHFNGDYHLGSGSDVIDIFNDFGHISGEAGNDLFRVDVGDLFGLELHGGQQNGAVTANESNTLDFHAAGSLGFFKIDGIESFKFTGPGTGSANDQFIFLTTDQIPGGAGAGAFQVAGSGANHANEIVIDRPFGEAVHVNLAGVTVTNFHRNNQAFFFDFNNGFTFNDSAVGVHFARNVFSFDAGNDTALGGTLADVFAGAGGNDRFNGRGGVDVAHFSGFRSQYTLTKVNANTWSVHDNRPDSPDGTDVMINVEYLKFANRTVYIGPPIATAESPPAAHDATHHAYDLFT